MTSVGWIGCSHGNALNTFITILASVGALSTTNMIISGLNLDDPLLCFYYLHQNTRLSISFEMGPLQHYLEIQKYFEFELSLKSKENIPYIALPVMKKITCIRSNKKLSRTKGFVFIMYCN